jgi:hypothetical protein
MAISVQRPRHSSLGTSDSVPSPTKQKRNPRIDADNYLHKVYHSLPPSEQITMLPEQPSRAFHFLLARWDIVLLFICEQFLL